MAVNVKTYNSPDELWNELELKDDEPWNEFKKRLLQSPNKSIVYDREGRKMLNVYACRGFKRMLTEGGKVTRKRWNEILSYFLPIVHKEKNKYATSDTAEDEPNEGFTLTNIAATLNCPAFLGPASDEDCRKQLSEKATPGEHCFRFSSQKGQFVMHLLGDDRQVAAYKIYPTDNKTHKLYLAFKNAREEFKTLDDLERKMPEWKTKFGVPFIPKKSEEFETLDENEKTLLNWLKDHNIVDVYPTIIKELSLKMDLEESLDGLKVLKDDPNFQASIGELKEKIENAFKEEEDEKKSGKIAKKPGAKKKPAAKKKEKVLV